MVYFPRFVFFKGHYTQQIYSRGLTAKAPEKLSGSKKGEQKSASSRIMFQGRALTKFQGCAHFYTWISFCVFFFNKILLMPKVIEIGEGFMFFLKKTSCETRNTDYHLTLSAVIEISQCSTYFNMTHVRYI